MGNQHGIRVIAAIALLIYCSSLLQCAESANILVYGAIGTHSTRISMFPFMEELSAKGHNVTYLSAYDDIEDPEKKSKVNHFTPEKWKSSLGEWEDHVRFFDIRKNGLMFSVWLNFHEMGIKACQVLYSDPEFVKWVKTAKYDLVIVEYVFNECGYGLAHLFKTKMVIYGTATMLPWHPDAHGFPDETSTLPDLILDFPSGNDMSFIQRVKNALSPIAFNIKREYTYFPVLEEITRNALGLGNDELPSFGEIEKNASLILLTTHVSTDLPRALPPHVIPIGGAVVNTKKVKPFSKELEEFVNSAKSGFVYISFGTVAEFTNFDIDVQIEFISALYAFPEIKFLWKSTNPINETLPENVMTTKWVPQQTVLAHPKLKAFITHCGMGGTTESINFGVPLIMLPVLGDQDKNANSIEAKGAGIKLEITTLKKHELEHALSEVIHNSKYRNSMKKLSDSFKDRPVQPVESGVWWIEYIFRHPNSNDYLVPLSVRQPWWKRRQIDVWLTLGACLFVGLSLCLAVLFLLVKALLLKCIFRRNTTNENKGKLMKKKNK